tara:strand:- start:419 stop:598 length:180 start_codon:yes stop_codon:yes gene_type:complete
MTYKRIGRYWHRLTTPQGNFYGHSREQVFSQAQRAERRLAAQVIPWPRTQSRQTARGNL